MPDLDTPHDTPRPPRVRLVHRATYRFNERVTDAELVLRLTPRALDRQQVEHHQVIVTPRPTTERRKADDFGNDVLHVALRAPTSLVEVQAVSTVCVRAHRVSAEALAAAEQTARELGVLPPPPSVGPRAGRCRALAERALERLGAHGVASRFVGGYVLPTTSGVTVPHAWVAMHLDDHGWIELDPMLGTIAPPHLVVAWGRSHDDVALIEGRLEGRGRYRVNTAVVVEALAANGP